MSTRSTRSMNRKVDWFIAKHDYHDWWYNDFCRIMFCLKCVCKMNLIDVNRRVIVEDLWSVETDANGPFETFGLLLGLFGWQSISHTQKSTWTWITRGTWQASKQIPPESGPWDLFRKNHRFPLSREIDGTCSALSDLHPFASFALKWSSSDLKWGWKWFAVWCSNSLFSGNFSRKLTLASARGGAGLSPTQWFFTRPPPSRGILKRCWKQMVTGSNPAIGNLYRSPPHWAWSLTTGTPRHATLDMLVGDSIRGNNDHASSCKDNLWPQVATVATVAIVGIFYSLWACGVRQTWGLIMNTCFGFKARIWGPFWKWTSIMSKGVQSSLRKSVCETQLTGKQPVDWFFNHTMQWEMDSYIRCSRSARSSRTTRSLVRASVASA